MDRSNFIRQSYLNNTSSCGQDDCECSDEIMSKKKELKNVKQAHLLAISLLAFLCAGFFALIKSNAAEYSVLPEKKSAVISCGANSIDKGGRNKLYKDRRGDTNNNNSCPHQLGASCVLYAGDTKRKKNHTC